MFIFVRTNFIIVPNVNDKKESLFVHKEACL